MSLKFMIIYSFASLVFLTSCKKSPVEPQPMTLGNLTGTVLDNENMQPVNGAIVLALRNQVGDTTDSSGSFRLDSLSTGVDSVRVSSADYDTLYTAINITGGAQETGFFLQPEKRPPGYYLYVGNWDYDEVFVVDTDRNAVVDTLRGFSSVWHLALSLDGTELYVCTREGSGDRPGKVFKVSLRAKEVALIWDGIASDVFIAPNGEPFIISYVPNSAEGYLGRIDRVLNTVTFFDTLNIRDAFHNYQSVVFDKNRPLLYAGNNDFQLFAYDYDKKEVARTYNFHGLISQMVLSHDGKTLYVAGGPIINLERDWVIVYLGGDRRGSLAMSPDGQYVYVTEPGIRWDLESFPRGKVFIFQTSTNSYIGEIDVNEASGHLYTPTNRIVLTPDGKTAYVNNSNSIFLIDLFGQQVTEVIRFVPGRLDLLPMVLGPKLND